MEIDYDEIIAQLKDIRKLERTINPKTMSLLMSVLNMECAKKLKCEKCSKEEMIRCLKQYHSRIRISWGTLLLRKEYKWAKTKFEELLRDIIIKLLSEAGITWKLWHKENEKWVEVINILDGKALIKVKDEFIKSPIEMYDLTIQSDADIENKKAKIKLELAKKAERINESKKEYKDIEFSLKRKFTIIKEEKVTIRLSHFDIAAIRKNTHKLMIWRRDNSLWLVPKRQVWRMHYALINNETKLFFESCSKRIEYED